MSLALVTETAREVRRLAQAGSDLARGDFRLERLREPLTTAGAKVPVFAKLAEAVGALTSAESAADTPDWLLSVATLAQAILATQAETGVGTAGEELRPLATTPTPGGTVAPYRQLEPVLTALSTTGSGRLEIVKHAFEQGHFNDLRLAAAAVRGLGDPLADIGSFLANTVLPALGAGIVPLLQTGLDPQGGKAHARRLGLIAQLRGPAENALYQEALENGSKEVKAAAVLAHVHVPGAEPMLRDLAAKGSKETRQAALTALGRLGSEENLRAVANFFLAESRPGNVDHQTGFVVVRAVASVAMSEMLAAEARRLLAALVREPERLWRDGTDDLEVRQFRRLIMALHGRADAASVALLRHAFAELSRALPTGDGLLAHIADGLLNGSGTVEDYVLVASSRGRFHQLFPYVFAAAFFTRSPQEVYEEFASLLLEATNQQRGIFRLVLHDFGLLEPGDAESVLERAGRKPRFSDRQQRRAAIQISGKEYQLGPLGDWPERRWDPHWAKQIEAARKLGGWPN